MQTTKSNKQKTKDQSLNTSVQDAAGCALSKLSQYTWKQVKHIWCCIPSIVFFWWGNREPRCWSKVEAAMAVALQVTNTYHGVFIENTPPPPSLAGCPCCHPANNSVKPLNKTNTTWYDWKCLACTLQTWRIPSLTYGMETQTEKLLKKNYKQKLIIIEDSSPWRQSWWRKHWPQPGKITHWPYTFFTHHRTLEGMLLPLC